MHQITIIGAGRLGGALALALAGKGYRIENLVVRDKTKAGSLAEHIRPRPDLLLPEEMPSALTGIVIIATQDAEIESVAARLAPSVRPEEALVFHTSGSFSSDMLRPLRDIGCPTGSLHPLVSISDSFLGATSFKDAYFCLEGDRQAVQTAERIVAVLEGRAFAIETRFKPLYHAAAVTACGHLVALLNVALEMLQTCGLDESAARETLLPLVGSTIENLRRQTTVEALTGPFARADVKTLQQHLQALDGHASAEVREIYLQLGERSVHLAQEQGANRESLSAILREISLAKKNLKC